MKPLLDYVDELEDELDQLVALVETLTEALEQATERADGFEQENAVLQLDLSVAYSSQSAALADAKQLRHAREELAGAYLALKAKHERLKAAHYEDFEHFFED